MTTVTRTAAAAGSVTLTTKNSGGQLLTPVSVPVVTWYTDAGRTTGALVLTVSGSGSSYTATWTGAQAPATVASRYLKVSIETATGLFSLDVDDDVLFLAASSTPGSTDYTTLAAVKSQLGITDSARDSLLSAAITAASRSIDSWTGTTFYPVTEARQFDLTGPTIWVDRFTSTAGLVLATGVRGVYSTVVPAANYVLAPYNAPSRGRAYDRILLPWGMPLVGYDGFPGVQVTAAWGWHFIPDEVEQATRIKAARLFRRKDTPEGMAGSPDFGMVHVSRFEDGDVQLLLAPYRDLGIA